MKTGPDRRPYARNARPTIQDIARACGVSKGTVNRAIHDKPGINAETKRRVLETIEEMRFAPSFMARSLATGRTHSIGVLLPNVDNEFFAMVCSEIEKANWERGYVTNLSFSDDRPDRETAVLRSFNSRSVDGLVIFPVSKDDASTLSALAVDTPVVILLNDLALPHVSAVTINEYEAMTRTIRYLVELGHRRIAYIDGYRRYSSAYNDFINEERYRAYVDTLAKCAIPRDPALTIEFDPRYYDSSDPAPLERLVSLDSPPTAIACFHDRIAIWVLRRLEDLGFRVPDDISLTGFDDIREVRYIRPRITTTGGRSRDVAVEAIDLLFRRILNPDEPARRTMFDVDLIRGDSCGPPGRLVQTHTSQENR